MANKYIEQLKSFGKIVSPTVYNEVLKLIQYSMGKPDKEFKEYVLNEIPKIRKELKARNLDSWNITKVNLQRIINNFD
jgi:hypothetical protein